MRTEPFPDDVFDALVADGKAAALALAEAVSAHADTSRDVDEKTMRYEAIQREIQLQNALRQMTFRRKNWETIMTGYKPTIIQIAEEVAG